MARTRSPRYGRNRSRNSSCRFPRYPGCVEGIVGRPELSPPFPALLVSHHRDRLMPDDMKRPLEIATLGGGCFWCLDAVYRGLRGVEKVESGYAGGEPANPSYELVCGGRTGHAEVVQVTFDPSAISFRELLDVFFVIHDPTTLDRQGADIGTQYRSVIYYHSPEQKS